MKDILGGAVLAIAGLAFAVYAGAELSLGSFRRMGPGMFPLILGITLAGFGMVQLLLGVAAWRSQSDQGELALPRLPVRPLAMVLLAVIAFGLLIRVLGLVPAIFVTVILATFADRALSLIGAVVLATCLSVLCWLIFIVGLNLPIQAFRF